MKVHLVDGTYELFRHYFAVPKQADRSGREVGALLGVVRSMLMMLEDGATHLGVATDHVVESFRNAMWQGYKTGEWLEPELHQQFHPLEEALAALGVVVWPMKEFEADDGLASAAFLAAGDTRVEEILICSPDKDLAQCVVGDRIIQFDRRKREPRNEAGVVAKFGVPPVSIPDYLALVGDTADGYPGIAGWGAKSASAVLARYHHLERIPTDAGDWDAKVRGAARLAEQLAADREQAFLFRTLATLRIDAPLFGSVDELRWAGPTAGFEVLAADLGAPALWDRARRIANR
ncbi:MAG: 5'-3' exonuclease H3TH domain-containing protein [Gemmatimonadales bacterium]